MHKYFKFFSENRFLILIVLLAAALRFYGITQAPPSLNWDEVSHGYNAYSILKTGKDEWGKMFPLANFRAYGDYPLPLNLYLIIPFIAGLGLNEISIRLPHAILGTLTILMVFFFAFGLSKNKKFALLTSFLVAITPWYLFTSRYVIQANLSIFLLIASMAAFFNRDKYKFLSPFSIILLFLSLFAYHTTRIFSPILLLALIFVFRKKLNLHFFLLTILFYVVFALLIINPDARARAKFVFLLNEGAITKIEEARNISKFNPLVKRLIFNRVTYFASEFSKNYIDYFSPDFLFIKGGTQYQFSVPQTGLIYLVCLPFFYLGLWQLIKKAKAGEANEKFLLLWLILAPIPASLTNERFAVLRATTMLPLPEVLIAIGVFVFSNFLKNKGKIIIPLFVVALLMSLEIYLNGYFKGYRINYSWAWQYGYKEVVDYAKQNYSKYDKIIVTKKYGEPHEFFLFFMPWDPNKYQNDPNLIRFYQSDWYWVDRFDKFFFVNDWQIPKMGERFVLESKK